MGENSRIKSPLANKECLVGDNTTCWEESSVQKRRASKGKNWSSNSEENVDVIADRNLFHSEDLGRRTRKKRNGKKQSFSSSMDSAASKAKWDYASERQRLATDKSASDWAIPCADGT